MSITDVPFYKPYLPDYALIESDFKEAYTSGILAPSKYTDRLVSVAKNYFKTKHVIAFSNCSDAMMCLLGYIKSLTRKNKVIIPDFTFAATWQAVDWNDMEAIVVDVTDEGLIDPVCVEKALASHGKDVACVFAVHIFGNPAPVNALKELSIKYKTFICYDSAHGIGATFNDSPLGNNGLAEVFSIGTTKTLASGEGALVTTSDDILAETMYRAAMHGHKYGELDVELKSLNGRIQEINSIIAYHGFSILKDNIDKKTNAAQYYNKHFPMVSKNYKLRRSILEKENVVPSYKDYTLFLEPGNFSAREKVIENLNKFNIGTKRYYYPNMCNLHVIKSGEAKINKEFCYGNGEKLANSCISIPFFASISQEEQDYVIEKLQNILNEL